MMKTLIVEDDFTSRLLLQGLLQPYGVCHICVNGREAIDAFKKALDEKESYNLVCLDIMMPHTDGWQILHALKSDPATREIPVILLSIVDNQALGFRLGASDYLLKPLDADVAVGALRRLARLGRAPIQRVLVVDDDPLIHDLARQLLSETYQLAHAADGQAALAAVQAQRPDAILLDLMMPGLDGFGVIAELQRRADTGQIPIVVITAKTLTAEETAWLQQNVSRIVHKEGLAGATLLQDLRHALMKYQPAHP